MFCDWECLCVVVDMKCGELCDIVVCECIYVEIVFVVVFGCCVVMFEYWLVDFVVIGKE